MLYEEAQSACEVVIHGLKGETFSEGYDRLKKEMDLEDKYPRWIYNNGKCTKDALKYIESATGKGEKVHAIIVIRKMRESKIDLFVAREVTIKNICWNDRRDKIWVEYEFGDYIYCDKKNLTQITEKTMDDNERFLGKGGKGSNQMCHYVRDGKKMYEMLHQGQPESEKKREEQVKEAFCGGAEFM